MKKTIEHIHWPDAPDMWMPYAPAIKARGGTTVYLAGVTAAPVYHHHPHRPEEFDAMPCDMEGQARAALENLKRGLAAVGADFGDVVTADRFVTDLTDQDALNRVWAEYFRDAKPATTTVCGSRPIRAVSSRSTQSLWSIERLPARRGRQRLKSQNKPLSTMLIRRQVASGK